ncbi:TetR/AcrR family transcriptional regulator [Calidifontibacillus oryziterrae]|uniref:TetR/AcrR family transcriptional regulator n=1 Tax=Calidifontibacillus oryziterrae TaxID=1191699 RepID=UPI0002D7B289|nr:TetR/AcrR family transcriptional regulator [Calidifontibacillus oryziterrae]
MKEQVGDELSTKDHILNVVLELINNEGFEAVTIRKIAALANVNVALVNYHFGSKEKLLNETVKVMIHSFKGCFTVFDRKDISALERLTIFLTNYASALGKFPGLLRQLVAIGTISCDVQNEFISFMKTMGYNKIINTLKEITGEVDHDKVTVCAVQIIGALVFPILMSPIVGKISEIDLPDTKSQVELLVNHYLFKYI